MRVEKITPPPPPSEYVVKLTEAEKKILLFELSHIRGLPASLEALRNNLSFLDANGVNNAECDFLSRNKKAVSAE